MSATESKAQPQSQPSAVAGVSMRDLLASCAAATAVFPLPPRVPDPQTVERPAAHRKAA
ncbi:hypothetical protein SALBM311S_05646 [Streptomyces alboniger]